MALLEAWRETAYNAQTDKKKMKEFWDTYFEKEKVTLDIVNDIIIKGDKDVGRID